MPNLKLRLISSLNACTKKQVANAAALGLRKIGQERVQPDNDATKGKIKIISHLVEVKEA